MPPTLSQLRLVLARRLRIRPRTWPCTLQTARRQLWLTQQSQQLRQSQQPPAALTQTGWAALRSRWFMATASSSLSVFNAPASLFTRMTDNDDEGGEDNEDNDDEDDASELGDGAFASADTSAAKRNDSSNRGGSASMFGNSRSGDAFAVDTLPALKVLSETFALMKQSPAFQNWNSTDWLMGLTVLAQHNTIQRKKRNVLSVLSDEANKKALENQELMTHLLKYVRVCDAVYASTLDGFCSEAGIARETIVKHHSGGVFSPKFVLVLDHASREIVLVVRGSASIMDFCTDLCLVNEPFQSGQGHRGMVHAATWLAKNIERDLAELTAAHPDYRVITTGHSLGASVAALTTMLLQPTFPTIHCFAFATPASVTQDLAHACYDFVTTVVNGDDCVPRLHQHSIHKLQGEVSAFDWRNTLKQLVTDEVEEQRTAVVRQKDEKLEQIYAAIRTFEELSMQQQNEALEKIDQVKRLATENITEFTNEIDRRVTASIDSTLSPFRTDKISRNHIEFIQHVLQTDDKQKRPFLWEKLDASVVALERLSAAVNKPDELERLIRESKELLKHTGAAPAESDGSSAAASGASSPPPLAIFRDRINSVINDATESLKTKVKGKMTQVTETVTTNVTDVVETVKVEAEAISSRIQSELDAAQREIAESTEAFVETAETLLPSRSSPPAPAVAAADSIDSMFQDLKAEVVDLTQLFSSSSSNGEADDESEFDTSPFDAEDDEDDAALPHDSHHHKHSESEQPLHDPLFPPGRILYLNRVPLTDAQQSDLNAASLGEEVELVEVGNDEFSRVVLSNNMILDHLCTTYERMLQSTKMLASSGSDSNNKSN